MLIKCRKHLSSQPELDFWALQVDEDLKVVDGTTGSPMPVWLHKGDWVLLTPLGLVGACSAEAFRAMFTIVN